MDAPLPRNVAAAGVEPLQFDLPAADRAQPAQAIDAESVPDARGVRPAAPAPALPLLLSEEPEEDGPLFDDELDDLFNEEPLAGLHGPEPAASSVDWSEWLTVPRMAFAIGIAFGAAALLLLVTARKSDPPSLDEMAELSEPAVAEMPLQAASVAPAAAEPEPYELGQPEPVPAQPAAPDPESPDLAPTEPPVIAGAPAQAEPAPTPSAKPSNVQRPSKQRIRRPTPAAKPKAEAGVWGAPVVVEGKARIVTDPAGAFVSVDGRPVGKTPLELQLELGEHEVIIQKRGFADVTDTIVLRAEEVTFPFELSEAP